MGFWVGTSTWSRTAMNDQGKAFLLMWLKHLKIILSIWGWKIFLSKGETGLGETKESSLLTPELIDS